MQHVGEGGAERDRDRIDGQRRLHFRNRVIEATEWRQDVESERVPRPGVVGAPFQDRAELALGTAPVPVVDRMDGSQRGPRLRQLRVEVERAPAELPATLSDVTRMLRAEETELDVHVRQPDVGRGERGIQLDRLLEERYRRAEAGHRAPVPMVATLEVEIVGLDVAGRPVHARRGDALAYASEHRLDRGARDRLLQGEDIVEIVVVARRGEHAAIGDLDQLGRDPQPVSRLAHAAGEQGPNLELLADRAWILGAELEGRRARCDAQAGHLAERGDELLGQTLAEPVLVVSGAHVSEGKDGEAGLLRGRHCGGSYWR